MKTASGRFLLARPVTPRLTMFWKANKHMPRGGSWTINKEEATRYLDHRTVQKGWTCLAKKFRKASIEIWSRDRQEGI